MESPGWRRTGERAEKDKLLLHSASDKQAGVERTLLRVKEDLGLWNDVPIQFPLALSCPAGSSSSLNTGVGGDVSPLLRGGKKQPSLYSSSSSCLCRASDKEARGLGELLFLSLLVISLQIGR